MYFNTHHKRVGKLFQGHYKAVPVLDEPYLLHLTRYIHRNPLELTKDLRTAYSSYAEYLGLRQTPWLNAQFVLSFFQPELIPNLKGFASYKQFVEEYDDSEKPDEILTDLMLEVLR